MYKVKTRNWHCKRWVNYCLSISHLWGVERGDFYDDGDGKFILYTPHRVCPKIKYLTYVALRYTHRLMAKNMSQRKAAEVAIQERFARLNDSLTERSRRLFAASEALAFGF